MAHLVSISDADRPRKPFWARCASCRHSWPVAWLPMELENFAEILLGARCPKCGDRQPVVARQEGGELRETREEGESPCR